eukprot:1703948-Pyramimonas_sp.AAC.1
MEDLMDQHSLHQWPRCTATRGSCSYAVSQSALNAPRQSATVEVAERHMVAARQFSMPMGTSAL